MSLCTTKKVKHIGNSWITCRSKSYEGRIYYFNTLTGEAVWNLSEPEIEKAKVATNILEKSDNFPIEDCPEPLGSPNDNIQQDKIKRQTITKIVPKVYNKQIINNQIARPLQEDFGPINPMQLGIPVPAMYNPTVLNIPTQPLLLASNNQSNYAVNQNCTEPMTVAVSSMKMTNRFKRYSQSRYVKAFPSIQKKFGKRIHMDMIHSQNIQKANIYSDLNNKFDLRELLLARKKRTKSLSESSQNNINDGVDYSSNFIKKNVQSQVTNDLIDIMRDDKWLPGNLNCNGFTGLLNIDALKMVVRLDNKSGLWYIVADTGVLLNNVNFLTCLLRSDNYCNLIIPQVVMEEIQIAKSSHLKTRACNAATFISEQINLGKAVIDEERLTENTPAQKEILSCCLRLSEQGCHVVMFTNHSEILRLKESVIYPILSIRDVKFVLCQTVDSSTTCDTNQVQVEKPIKITIPNQCIPYENNVTHIHDSTMTDDLGSKGVPDESNFMTGANENVSQDLFSCSESIVGTNDCRLKRKGSAHAVNVDQDTQKNKIKQLRCILQKTLNTSSTKRNNFKCRRKKTKRIRFGRNSIIIQRNPNESSNSSNDTLSNESRITPRGVDVNTTTVHVQVTNTNDEREDAGSNYGSYCNLKKTPSNNATGLCEDDKHVMFEVTCQSMEDNLRTKCDEWIYRFTQIMEDILTQILQQEPEFICEAMPPPWTMYEALECIKRKFISDNDVVDATNKLCNTLYELGGLRGKINSTISPQKYMELYSFGVYLTDAFQSVLVNCEDLQIATESLAKLLCDIQYSHMDISNQDSIGDFTFEEAPKEIESANESGKILISEETSNNTTTEASNRSNCKATDKEIGSSPTPDEYNLRSCRGCPVQETITDDPQSDFFANLNLWKTTKSDAAIMDNDMLPDSEELLNVPSVSDKGSIEHVESNSQTTPADEKNFIEPADEKNSIEPKIIRNFVPCLEFENRIKSKINSFDTYDVNMDELNYSENEEGTKGDCAYDGDLSVDDYDENDHYEYDNGPTCDEEEDTKRDNNIRYVIDQVLKEAKNGLTSIHMFCVKAYDVLNSSGQYVDRTEMLRDAEEAHKMIRKVCKSLASILTRESYSDGSIWEVVRNAPSARAELDEAAAASYRKVIGKFLEQGNILKESVSVIIDACTL